MLIALAYPWTSPDGRLHEPNETVEVDDRTGKQLIRDGRARAAAASAFATGGLITGLSSGGNDDRVQVAAPAYVVPAPLAAEAAEGLLDQLEQDAAASTEPPAQPTHKPGDGRNRKE